MTTAEKMIAENVSDLPTVAEKILERTGSSRIIVFYGEMGAGKTTLIKAICRKLGVEGTVSSPTFSLVNEYISRQGKKIYHFDFYRLKNETEALDIGCEEYFASGNYCFIEWPEKIKHLLPATACAITISANGDERVISFA